MTHRQLVLLGYPVVVGLLALLLHFVVFPRVWSGYNDDEEIK